MSIRRDDNIDIVQRPDAQPRLSERARAWVEWFGVTRLVTSAIATTIVCVGAYWLIRTPPPPTEAALPPAAANSLPVATLPVATIDAVTAHGTPDEQGMTLIVHVAGAVGVPGVYELSTASRVADAVDAAGGPAADADLDLLNLAAVVADGSRVYVPTVGEDPPVVMPVGVDAPGQSVVSGPLDVNRSTPEQLESLPGVGPATAQAIVAERNRNGPFASVADLDRVPGIGPAKLAALHGLVMT